MTKFTRYFKISGVNPTAKSYDSLIRTCFKIDACLGFNKRVDPVGRVRVTGFLILRGRRAYVDQLVSLFPNWLLSVMEADEFGYIKKKGFLIPAGTLPFEDIKRVLF
ncbi:MAG: hypothetical protein ACRCZI_12955 [Cetobacterium sp.]